MRESRVLPPRASQKLGIPNGKPNGHRTSGTAGPGHRSTGQQDTRQRAPDTGQRAVGPKRRRANMARAVTEALARPWDCPRRNNKSTRTPTGSPRSDASIASTGHRATGTWHGATGAFGGACCHYGRRATRATVFTDMYTNAIKITTYI